MYSPFLFASPKDKVTPYLRPGFDAGPGDNLGDRDEDGNEVVGNLRRMKKAKIT